MSVTSPNPAVLTEYQQVWAKEYEALQLTRRVALFRYTDYQSRAGSLSSAESAAYREVGLQLVETERQIGEFRNARANALQFEMDTLQAMLNRTPPDKLLERDQLSHSIASRTNAMADLWGMPSSMFELPAPRQVQFDDKIYDNAGYLRWDPSTFVGNVQTFIRPELESFGRGVWNVITLPDQYLSTDQKYSLCKTLSGMLGGFIGGSILSPALGLPKSSMLDALLNPWFGKRGPTTPAQMASDILAFDANWAFKTTGDNGGCRIYVPRSRAELLGLGGLSDGLMDFLAIDFPPEIVGRVIAEERAASAAFNVAMDNPSSTGAQLNSAAAAEYDLATQGYATDAPSAFAQLMRSRAEGASKVDAEMASLGPWSATASNPITSSITQVEGNRSTTSHYSDGILLLIEEQETLADGRWRTVLRGADRTVLQTTTKQMFVDDNGISTLEEVIDQSSGQVLLISTDYNGYVKTADVTSAYRAAISKQQAIDATFSDAFQHSGIRSLEFT